MFCVHYKVYLGKKKSVFFFVNVRRARRSQYSSINKIKKKYHSGIILDDYYQKKLFAE